MLRFSSLAFFLVSAFGFVLPSQSFAQLSIPGKVTTYRTLDLDSGEELERSRSWQVLDGQGARELTAIAIHRLSQLKLITIEGDSIEILPALSRYKLGEPDIKHRDDNDRLPDVSEEADE